MKKLYILLFTILISSLSFGQNIAVNGGFEDWLSGSLDGGWTTVDFSTTDLTQNTNSTYITEGSSSASILLQTQDQSITDMLQSVNMVAGITYTISVDVYATDNQARARLFGPSYTPSVYSDATVLNTWQTITIDYTPGTTGAAVIGMRFYDTAANWTGSGSQFYIDNFQIINPSTDPSLALSDGPANNDVLIADPETLNNANIDFVTSNFTMCTDATGTTPSGCDGYIKWSVENTNGNVFVAGGDVFTSNDTNTTYPVNGLAVGETYFFRAELVDSAGAALSSPVVYSFTFTIASYNDVPDLATLRAQTVDPDSYYRVTGSVVNTYTITGTSQSMYFQDGTGGILVYDPNYSTSTYNTGDAVSNIRGHLETYNGVLELVPSDADWGAPTTTGNVPSVSTATIATLLSSWENYESELVKITGATFADAGIPFASFTNYNITDATGTMTFRTSFTDADYIGQNIPSGNQDLVVIVAEFGGAPQVTSRSLADITLDTQFNQIDGFGVYPNPTSLGYVNISSKNSARMDVTVFDILGKQVLNKTLSNNTLDVSHLTSGIYIMKVSQENAISTQKLVIQ